MIHRKLIPTLVLFCLHLTAGWSANLAELAQTALSRNLSLQISDLEIEQSFIEEKKAFNALIPDVNFNVSKTHKDFKDDYQKKSPASIDNMQLLTQAHPELPWPRQNPGDSA